jgi:hypothetical protein
MTYRPSYPMHVYSGTCSISPRLHARLTCRLGSTTPTKFTCCLLAEVNKASYPFPGPVNCCCLSTYLRHTQGSLVRMIGIRCRYVEKRATVQLREDNVVHIMFCLADQKLWFGNKGVRREHNTTGRYFSWPSN